MWQNGSRFAIPISRPTDRDVSEEFGRADKPNVTGSPAWGQIGRVRNAIGTRRPVQASSGTLPPHIKKIVKTSLNLTEERLVTIDLPSNRPGTLYAMHEIVGSRADARNLKFVISPNGEYVQTLLFFDDSKEAASMAAYITSLLPEDKQLLGIVRHYHGGMSKPYLQAIFDSFADPTGMCKILCATSGASTGLDVAGIPLVIQYGIPRDISSLLQRGGRAGRSTTAIALYIMMYEPWVLQIDISGVSSDIASDPDRPILEPLQKNSSKQERTSWEMYHIFQQKISASESAPIGQP
ncbi:hypothetical protein D9611_011739 [Ephemerocybe angulata]|uniref:ATP-dependent RNA helicase n=1 Tax=Ephemerocybe angulata TaxID=980116 RepID=A0A8H5C514_9AGAR|nr:hypothetical protein D9611_011739 [Tulosesus angulatus]